MYLWINKKGHLLFSDLIIHRRDEKVDEVTLQCTKLLTRILNVRETDLVMIQDNAERFTNKTTRVVLNC